jgi:carboxyl-terminal processing protease
VESIQGREGTQVALTVSRGGALIELTAVRAEMEVPLIHARLVAPEIGYLHYSAFRPRSEEDFIDAVRVLRAKGAKKLIIDLRGNPGGDLHAANGVLASLLPRGLDLISTRHRGKIESSARTYRDGPFADMERVVLVDERSASASDLTAATLQDYGATVIGPANSYGKFSVQQVIGLSKGSGIKITTGRTYSGKGRSLPGTHDARTGQNVPGSGGVTPDEVAPMTEEEQGAVFMAMQERLHGESPAPVSDPVLDRAIQLLRSR